MTDGFWNRQQPLVPSPGFLKRPRTEYDDTPSGLTSGNGMHNYIAQNNGHQMSNDTKTLGSAYDSYLRSAGLTSFNSGEAGVIGGVGLARGVSGIPGHSLGDPSVMGRPGGPEVARNGRNVNFGGQLPIDAVSRPRPESIPLPPDASSTLYVEGLPSDCTKREVAHLDIFRPFVGYREVRLVTKESKHRSGDPLILCFVDFANPPCAATAMSALQGYRVDELNPDSNYLRLQFSRSPGPRSGPAPRGKR
ncbi:RNA-binding protein 2-like isoform X2 [Trifolium pratense]|uniref:RNA-binding protein 2-like isoform X2 n=1 Tax=Trifolium pratense TaxID=57577 RepID=UPI001E69737C|nr:RNA-binding protein 2-like isoform X2 [Trifolium pratense]